MTQDERHINIQSPTIDIYVTARNPLYSRSYVNTLITSWHTSEYTRHEGNNRVGFTIVLHIPAGDEMTHTCACALHVINCVCNIIRRVLMVGRKVIVIYLFIDVNFAAKCVC